MRAFVVVDVLKGGQECVEVVEGGGFGLGAEPAFQGLVEAFDLALGLGVAGVAVFLGDAEVADELFEFVQSWCAVGEAGGIDAAVVGQC